MRKICISFFVMTPICFAVCSTALPSDDSEARTIMEKVDARDDGDDRVADMEMILIDKKGQKRIRKIHTFQKDKGEDTLRLMFFLHPADVKDTAFLTYDYNVSDKDDDQWLYLPALRKTKRIASSDKDQSFMGSDLNYSDMTSRNLDDYDFSFYEKQKEMDVHGAGTWVLWSIPRNKKVIDETGYKKSILWVRQDNYVVVRAIHWEKSGDILKYVDVKKLEQIEGIWVTTEMLVTRKREKEVRHKTILKFDNIKFNQGLDEGLFTVRRMEKGL